MNSKLRKHLKGLLAIVGRLQRDFPQRQFTLDGRIIGDIGEVYAAETYDVVLSEKQMTCHDARCSDGRNVQIKTTMKGRFTFPVHGCPNYCLALHISTDGNVTEVYNGPGKRICAALKGRAKPANGQFLITLNRLQRLNTLLSPDQRIPQRVH